MSQRDALASLAHLAPPPRVPAPIAAARVGQMSLPGGGAIVPAVTAGALILPILGAAINGYHGYVRNRGNLPWTAVWTAGGFFFPVPATTAAIAQGYASKL